MRASRRGSRSCSAASAVWMANGLQVAKQAEEAVAQAVSGAARAVQLAPQASQKVDG